jgi:hypothetical protein
MQSTNTASTKQHANKRTAWFKIIEDYQNSGQSQVGYCRQHNINKDHFAYYLSTWRAKNTDSSKSVPFVAMQIIDAEHIDKWVLKITKDITLEIPNTASMPHLAELIINLRAKVC